jgi:hypothetical protein
MRTRGEEMVAQGKEEADVGKGSEHGKQYRATGRGEVQVKEWV